MKKRIQTLDDYISEHSQIYEGTLKDRLVKFLKLNKSEDPSKKDEIATESPFYKELTNNGWTALGFDDSGKLVGNHKKYGIGVIVMDHIK